jgi:ankyrin repeat protein
MLLQHGAEVNVRNKADLTPLDLVSPRGETEFMELLIENGADVNSRDKEHFTPLHKASFCGQAEAMPLLIRHGADVNARDRRGNSTPLHSVMSVSAESA